MKNKLIDLCGLLTLKRRNVLFIASAIALTTLFFYRDHLEEGKVIAFRDTLLILYPIEVVAAKLLSYYWIPAWNPYFVLGKPFAAEPLSGVLYPVQWLSRLFPLPYSITANLIVHHLIAAVGAAFVCIRLRYSTLVSFYCGVLFSFGGTLVSLDNMTNALQSSAWLPWFFLTSLSISESPRAYRALCGAIVTMSLTFLGGMPEVVIFENVTLISCFLCLSLNLKNLSRLAFLLVIINISWICLSAAHFLPLLEYLRESTRAQGLSAEQILHFSAEVSDILAFLFYPRVDSWKVLASGEQVLSDGWLVSLCLGSSLVFLAPLTYPPYSRRMIVGFLCGVLCFLVSLGNNLPVITWLVEHAPLQVARYPEKLLILVHSVLVLGIGAGLTRITVEQKGLARMLVVVVLVGVMSAVGLVTLEYTLIRSESFRSSLIHGAGASIALWFLIRLGNRRLRLSLYLLLALSCAEVYYLNGSMYNLIPWHNVIIEPSAAQTILASKGNNRYLSLMRVVREEQSHVQVYHHSREILGDSIGALYGLQNFGAPSSLNLSSHTKLIEAYQSASPSDQVKLLRIFGVQFLVDGQKREDPYLEEIDHMEKSVLYRVTSPLPDAYLANRVVVRPSEEVYSTLRSPEVIQGNAVVPTGTLPMIPSDGALIPIAISAETPEEIKLTVKTRESRLLVVNRTYFPGWKASINEEDVSTVPINGAVLGVALPPGHHEISLYYDRRILYLGLGISFLSGIVLLIIFLLADPTRYQNK